MIRQQIVLSVAGTTKDHLRLAICDAFAALSHNFETASGANAHRAFHYSSIEMHPITGDTAPVVDLRGLFEPHAS